MTNKQLIENKLNEMGLKLGGYSKGLDNLTKKALAEVIEGLDYGDSTDIGIVMRRRKYVIEAMRVDDEMDVYLKTAAEYEEKYGRDYFEDEDY